MICPNCRSTKIFKEKGYDSIYRCHNCNKVGNKSEFELIPDSTNDVYEQINERDRNIVWIGLLIILNILNLLIGLVIIGLK